jgi:hypothetical protein
MGSKWLSIEMMNFVVLLMLFLKGGARGSGRRWRRDSDFLASVCMLKESLDCWKLAIEGVEQVSCPIRPRYGYSFDTSRYSYRKSIG